MGSETPRINLEASDNDRRLATARAWLKANAAPLKAFPEVDLFTNPAWNIMLELYVSYHGHSQISVSSLCIASGAPATTALRYIASLTSHALIRRREDLFDHRRSFVELTSLGIAGVNQAIDSVLESDRKLGLSRLDFIKSVERQL